jgi:hypothetical protein
LVDPAVIPIASRRRSDRASSTRPSFAISNITSDPGTRVTSLCCFDSVIAEM